MSTRAHRLMSTMGGFHSPKQSEDDGSSLGGDGSLSQLGTIPNGPLRKRQQTLAKGKKKGEDIRTCHVCRFPGISESAKICPECGTKQKTNEEWDDRVRKTRRALREKKDSWIESAVETILAVLDFADPGSLAIVEDGTAREELRGRVTEALVSFSEWQKSQTNN